MVGLRRRWTAGIPRELGAGPALVTVFIVSGCAGATVGSGVGDTTFEKAPYYAGRPAAASGIAYLPVTFQTGATEPASFDLDAGDGGSVAGLLTLMNAWLDSVAASRMSGPLEPPEGTPPDVLFGCSEDEWGECVFTDEDGDGDPDMRLAVGRPSKAWTGDAATALAHAGADALLVITLETGHYWPRQTNWRGSKAVDLGTDRTVGLPWLTSLEMPVSVLQLTGALVGPDGRAIRIGAEGLRARRTSLVPAGFGFQALVTEEDVEALLAERVEDRPDAPLVWQEALRTLVERLTGLSTRG